MELVELVPGAIDYIYTNIVYDALTPWEKKFVEDTSDRWNRTRFLTDDQKLKLGEIWDRQP